MNEYPALCQNFSNWGILIEEILSDLKNVESHHYVVAQDKSGCIESNNIVYDIVYRCNH